MTQDDLGWVRPIVERIKAQTSSGAVRLSQHPYVFTLGELERYSLLTRTECQRLRDNTLAKDKFYQELTPRP